ncbi:sensor histidine kinase, partial [Streptococcus pyogenes]
LHEPSLIVSFAMARGIASDAEIVLEPSSPNTSSDSNQSSNQTFKPSKLRLNTNYHVILYDSKGNIVISLDRLSGIASIPLKTDKLEQILDKTVTTAFG